MRVFAQRVMRRLFVNLFCRKGVSLRLIGACLCGEVALFKMRAVALRSVRNESGC